MLLKTVESAMCNLYNLTTNQQAIRDVAQVMQDFTRQHNAAEERRYP